jgi:hypothetical protein
MVSTLTPQEFIARWAATTLTERSASQSHFIDLCDLLGQPRPAASDQAGAFYTFEKGVSKAGGGKGFADVWLRGHFAWEYKGKHKDLSAAYKQLLLYRDDLDNPPLLVLCDLDRFEVHTNFTNTAKQVYAFGLADLASAVPTPSSPLTQTQPYRPAHLSEAGSSRRSRGPVRRLTRGFRTETRAHAAPAEAGSRQV